MQPGFTKADSRTLPSVNMVTVWDFLRKDDRFNAPEVRAAKTFKAGRDDYGDAAIGYVCLRREGTNCIVKARVCPEHKVKATPYSVTLIVNEKNEEVVNLECHSCAAAKGGCKHAIAFLMWIHRRSSEPSPTEVQCYWKKSVLSSVATSIKYKTMRELTGHEPTINENELDNSTFFADVIKEAKEKQLDSQLSRHNFQLKTREEYELSLHRLLVHFNATGESNAENFLDFASNRITQNLCKKAEVQTQNQSDNVLWHELRYGRITASKLYEAAHCTTSKGTFVNTVIGAAKVFDTLEMERGRILEKKVIQVAAEKLNFTYKDCGFVIKPNYPVIGASPDAITDQFVIEVKCPNSDKALNNFLPKGELNSKCKAQINLQMFATGLLKGLFIVASPDFEKSEKISLKWVDYDKKYTFTLIDQAMDFWKINIYPILLNSVTE